MSIFHCTLLISSKLTPTLVFSTILTNHTPSCLMCRKTNELSLHWISESLVNTAARLLRGHQVEPYTRAVSSAPECWPTLQCPLSSSSSSPLPASSSPSMFLLLPLHLLLPLSSSPPASSFPFLPPLYFPSPLPSVALPHSPSPSHSMSPSSFPFLLFFFLHFFSSLPFPWISFLVLICFLFKHFLFSY